MDSKIGLLISLTRRRRNYAEVGQKTALDKLSSQHCKVKSKNKIYTYSVISITKHI
jgi:hypothetical protein